MSEGKIVASIAFMAMKAALAPHGWELDMIGEYDGFAMRPPADRDYPCPMCDSPLLEVVVMTAAEDGHGHAQPCGCRIMPDDLHKVLHTQPNPEGETE